MKKNKEKTALIVGAIVVSTALILLLYLDKRRKEQFYLQKKIEKVESEFFIIGEKFDKISELFVNTKVKNSPIPNIILTKNFDRRFEIYDMIYDDFRILKKYGYKNIIFFLPDGSLFLDTENSKRYGKKLDIDSIIVVSNNLNNAIDKRFYDSLVYSYVLFSKNEVAGTVYFIIPLYTIGKNLSDIFKNYYVFYIKKEFISIEGKTGFIQTELNPDYFVDKQFYNLRLKARPEETNILAEINSNIKESVKHLLQREESFSIPHDYNGNKYIITFYSIKSINDRHIGYLVSYEIDNTFGEFSRWFYISSGLIILIVVIVSAFILYILKIKAIAEKNAITDKLTGALNRTAIEVIINTERERAKRAKKPISIILFDIDFFKKINDTYGHDVGDYVLKTVVELIRKNIRKSDYLIRWGGEEFMILLPETDIDSTIKIAEKLRSLVENYQFKTVGKVTISLGLTQLKTGEDFDSAVKRADESLYLAKNRGRNRVEFSHF